MPTADRARRAFDLVEAALDRPAEEREAFLRDACAEDKGLYEMAHALLTAEDDLDTHAVLPGLFEPPAATDLLGQAIGPYTLTQEIGQGGMGTVYLAHRDDLDKEVALKLIRHGRLAAPEHIQRFRLEQRLLARLDHPHIAHLLDAGLTDEGLPFFAMEYVEGEPITDYCDAHRLGITERLRLFEQVCAAVQFAHQNLIVHRDLKPSNILVTEEGQVKLLDFGIAKLLDDDAEEGMTRTGMHLMTPDYAAPEQVRGEPVTTATDVYALGIVLYELLTGHRPYRFTTRSLTEIIRVVNEVEPDRPSTRVGRTATLTNGEEALREITPAMVAAARGESAERLQRRLGGDLDAVALQALRKDPARRYPSAEQLGEDIRRHLHNLPIWARRDTVAYRMQKFARRHRAGVAVAGVGLLLLVGFGVRERSLRAEAEQARDAARIEAAKAERVSGFLVDIFEVADPNEALGDTITAREIVDRGAARIEELAEEPEVQATMMTVLGRVYSNLGLYATADPMLTGALAQRQTLWQDAHPDVAESLDQLGDLRFREGNYPVAESLSVLALALRRQLLGDAHPDVAESLDHLARAYLYQARYQAADSLHRQALAMRRQALGDTHPDVAKSLFNLGVVQNRMDKNEAAEASYREALAIRRAFYGNQHPSVAEVLDNLGAVMIRLGDMEAGEASYREALALRRAIYGDEHPEVAAQLNKLGVLLMRKEAYDEAEVVLREALAQRRTFLGEENPDVATTLYNLAGLMEEKGEMDTAEGLYRQTLAMERKVRGETHPHVVYDLYDLARFLWQKKQEPREAEQLFRESLALARTVFGEEDPLTFPLTSLAAVLMEQQRFQEGEPLLREALDRIQLQPDSLRQATIQSQLGACLTGLQQYEEADSLLLASYAILNQQAASGDPRTVEVLEHLVALYDAKGQPDDAAIYRARLADASAE